MQDKTPYELIGEDAGVETLVTHFYDIMDEDQAASEIRQLHAKSLKISREKLILFLTGWLGGPDVYVKKYGHPRLRRRHLPFSIGMKEKDQWLKCMYQAIDRMELDKSLVNFLQQAFWKNADHMKNREEEAVEGIPFPIS